MALPIIGAVTLGILLNRLQDKISKKISDERAKALGQVNGIAQEALESLSRGLSLRIEQMRQVYSEELDQTIDKIEPIINSQLESLSDATDRFVSMTNYNVSDITRTVQLVSNNWIFSSRFSQVVGYSPNALFGNEDMPVTFRGNFTNQGEYFLRIEDKKITPHTQITTELQFSLPAEFFSNAQSNAWLVTELNIPKPTAPLQSLICGQQYDRFKIGFVIFPDHVGKVVLYNGGSQKSEEFNLKWGAQLERSVVAKNWKLTLITYNRSHYQFSSTHLEGPHLKIKDYGKKIFIAAKQPEPRLLELRILDSTSLNQNLISTQTIKPANAGSKKEFTPAKRSLTELSTNILPDCFKSCGTKCPSSLKANTPLYKNHIEGASIKEIRWAKEHETVAIYKNGKWRFYWERDPFEAVCEEKEEFDRAFYKFKPLYLKRVAQKMSSQN